MQRDVGARDQLPEAPPNGKPSFPDPCGSSSLTARARSCCPGPGSTVGNRKKPQRRHPTSTQPGQVTPATPHLLSNRLPSRCFARPDCQLLSLAVCLLTRPQISPVTRSRLNPAISSPTSAHSPLNDPRLRFLVFPPPTGTKNPRGANRISPQAHPFRAPPSSRQGRPVPSSYHRVETAFHSPSPTNARARKRSDVQLKTHLNRLLRPRLPFSPFLSFPSPLP